VPAVTAETQKCKDTAKLEARFIEVKPSRARVSAFCVSAFLRSLDRCVDDADGPDVEGLLRTTVVIDRTRHEVVE